MAAAEDQSLLNPLIPKTTEGDNDDTAASASNSGILLRLLSVVLVGAVSVWANHEAAKGFNIIIVNDAKDSPLGRKFELFYQSDDTAVRILLDTSKFAEKFLYDGVPDHHWKPVNKVTIRFSRNKSIEAERIPVTSGARQGEYIINLSSSLIEDRDYNHIIKWTLRRAMVKIWIWCEETGAPPQLVDGMAEHIATVAVAREEEKNSSQPLNQIIRGGSDGCWKDKDHESVAKFLAYCDGLSEGFIQRLNQGMRHHRWDDRTVDMAFGKRSEGACGSYREMLSRVRHGR